VVARTAPKVGCRPAVGSGSAGICLQRYRQVRCPAAFDVAENSTEQGVEPGAVAGWERLGDEVTAQVDEVRNGLPVQFVSGGGQDNVDACLVGGVPMSGDSR
jgi:hypothetical protein